MDKPGTDNTAAEHKQQADAMEAMHVAEAEAKAKADQEGIPTV